MMSPNCDIFKTAKYNSHQHFSFYSKQNHYSQILHKFKNTWKTINGIIGRTNDETTNDETSLPQNYTINNNKTSNSNEIADSFCNYFTNIGPKCANDIPEPINNARYHLHHNRQRNPTQMKFTKF